MRGRMAIDIRTGCPDSFMRETGTVDKAMESTGRALVDHWSWAAEKGLMNKNTAGTLRAACSQILSSVDDNWETLDIRELNPEDAFRRFQNKRGKDFRPNSLHDYARRFKQAHSSYLKYLEDPASWRFESFERAPRNEGARHPRPRAKTEVANFDIDANLVRYPFPVREGQTALLCLPPDLKTVEAKRLTTFIMTLAIDGIEAPSLT
jgi:hypothetical protein